MFGRSKPKTYTCPNSNPPVVIRIVFRNFFPFIILINRFIGNEFGNKEIKQPLNRQTNPVQINTGVEAGMGFYVKMFFQ